MSMLDVIRAQMAQSLPFIRFVGVDIVEVGPGRGVAAVGAREELSNHIGTQHAGVIFTLGEAASGAAMSGAFADIIPSIRPVAAEASIRYLKLARGALTATATLAEPVEQVRAAFAADRRAAFTVAVSIRDDREQVVAEMRVAWSVRNS